MDSVPSTEKKEKNQIDDFDRAVRESKAATLKMYNGDPRWFSRLFQNTGNKCGHRVVGEVKCDS